MLCASQLNRLPGTIAYTCCFIHNVCKLQPPLCGPFTSSELSDTHRRLFIAVQHCGSPAEIAYLLKKNIFQMPSPSQAA